MIASELAPIGRTSLKVTRLGFGTAPLGGFRGAIPDEEAAATLAAAWTDGVRYFDTAPYYGYGRSELRLGGMLRDKPRDEFVLSTKVGRWMEPLGNSELPGDLKRGGLPFMPRFDYSAAGTTRTLEQSMMRLGLSRIDIVYIHDVDVFTHGTAEAADLRYREAMEGCYPELERLRDDGVIGAIGVGLNETERSLRFAKEADIDCILLAGRYTLLEQEPLDELLPVCIEKSINVVLGGPYNSGVLATGTGVGASFDYGAVPPAVEKRVGRLQKAAAAHGISLISAALQFPLAHPAVASVVPGAMSRIEQEANAAALDETIPVAFWDALREQGLLRADAPTPT